MATEKVGIREFRDNLATHLLGSKGPMEITRHGETIGLYIPVPRKRTEEERVALRIAHETLQKEMEEKGFTEEDILADFKRWRASERKR